ncbi:MAG TPA: CPBP family intramembrane glutamic endopeptidase, partial [Caulobacteraceae bacterium]|nr:CPBP family intramembrane glutamic endopeptidase [Caulobacteraceae bacterium]
TSVAQRQSNPNLRLAKSTKTEHQSTVAIDLSHPDRRAPLTQIVALHAPLHAAGELRRLLLRGINEEILTRLLGVSGLVWLIGLVDRAKPAPDWAVWAAILAMAVLFGLGHLPATKAVAGKITGLILLRALALNGPIAILCGWLFWHYGIEAAIVAHFSADIVYHVGGTALLQANDKHRFMRWFPPPSNSKTIH